MFLNVKVGAQTETELKEKKLRVEDALNATKVIYNFKSLILLAWIRVECINC